MKNLKLFMKNLLDSPPPFWIPPPPQNLQIRNKYFDYMYLLLVVEKFALKQYTVCSLINFNRTRG